MARRGRNEGSVFKQRGKWIARVRYTRPGDAHKNQGSAQRTFARQKDAIAALPSLKEKAEKLGADSDSVPDFDNDMPGQRSAGQAVSKGHDPTLESGDDIMFSENQKPVPAAADQNAFDKMLAGSSPPARDATPQDELEMFADVCTTNIACELSANSGNVALSVVYAALRSVDRNGQAVSLSEVIEESRARLSAA